ncbi:succinylcoa synthetase beta chain, putative [Acanthamoeba castellanii str. Neff]|uniref:Succinate--CoA ligase [ADP-forming] subunit beta, mitochondrial n=1 Tax=Acanthamoeba castellanii (strain ATCC 30010 / Neff) TaxID=1257118 RepID=L8HMD9_ACACF|nr:succinylcoa synthetase beta chain, putative [Acanthamoeba castellanii str. Neff]ELR25551.1 succinylcoa synthetase beta chain, putative [Acanthamoeba castellanii str. Neff]
MWRRGARSVGMAGGMGRSLPARSALLQSNTATTLTSTSAQTGAARRWLNIHEYQSQELMRKEGIRVPKGQVAASPEEAYKIAQQMQQGGDADVIVKAQVLAGGRGVGHFDSGLKGGVHTCTSPEEVKDVASKMLGHHIFTKQTGPEGKPCNVVYLAERLFIRRETYFAILMDRAYNGPVIIGSSKGGSDIETLSAEHPDAIFKIPIDIAEGVTPEKLELVADKLGFQSTKVKEQTKELVSKLYDLFIKKDCTLAEINPLVEDHQGQIVALDAKLRFDDNAEFRQKEIFALRDESQEDPREVAASKFDLNYIQLNGNIGCLVNGAGLAMATMDIIKLKGGNPANFLDVGGGATEKQVTEAFRIFSSDKSVKAVMVNIFGGIMRCDIIAMGILNAVKVLNIKVPLVVRLLGTNMKEAKDLLENSGARIIFASDLDEAAEKAVKVARIVDMAQEAQLNVSFELPL